MMNDDNPIHSPNPSENGNGFIEDDCVWPITDEMTEDQIYATMIALSSAFIMFTVQDGNYKRIEEPKATLTNGYNSEFIQFDLQEHFKDQFEAYRCSDDPLGVVDLSDVDSLFDATEIRFVARMIRAIEDFKRIDMNASLEWLKANPLPKYESGA